MRFLSGEGGLVPALAQGAGNGADRLLRSSEIGPRSTKRCSNLTADNPKQVKGCRGICSALAWCIVLD